ncbi:glycosyltransferase family 2 protein [Steroidobacter sp. S1-65]|uniref:Glycosyltransferase family 2 protein n=1 Tax=Steroidobacter gossypii TaxID=2805490 RepID=A0ABS1WZ15_9GAMM|nr:glycosyltransferase family A protein [Steroidobacter gossypii]MBM0106201.1 glycosyltransferase family 2 protein [Steroidobacter gossypii]
MSNPLVSVIIPTYNRAALVREAVESVLKQTYREIEIIVIDDGSTDDTAAAMQAYGNRIRYSRRPHAGENAARNVGFKQAKGQYLALLDSDDLWEPYKIELQVALLKKFSDVGFTFSNFAIFRGASPESGACHGDGIATWFEHEQARRDPYRWRQQFASLGLSVGAPLPRDFTVSGGDIYGASLFCPHVLPSTTLIRASALGTLRLQEFDLTCGDWEFFARLSKERGCVYADLETTFNRSHEDAVRLTRVDASTQLGRRIAMIDRVWRADRPFYSHHRDEVDEVQHRLLLQAAKQQLLTGRGAQARASLKRAKALRTDASMEESMLRALAGIPGSGLLLMALRASVHGMRRLAVRE